MSMPRRLHYGRPNSAPAVPAGWASAHAPVVEGTFSCTVTIRPPGGVQHYDSELGQTLTTAAPAVYVGPAAVRPVVDSDGAQVLTGDSPVRARTYEIEIPLLDAGAALVERGHQINVTDSADPLLEGEPSLSVTDVEVADRAFTRVVYAIRNT